MNEDVLIHQIEDDETSLKHYGTLHKSGRYPWGSGENANQRYMMFLDHVASLSKQGLSDVDIVKGLGLESTTQLRALKTIASNGVRRADVDQAMKLKDRGNSNVAIGRIMGKNESTIRSLLDPELQKRQDELVIVADMLRDKVKEVKYLDIGGGTENHLGISQTKLQTAVSMLKEDGYVVYKFQQPQLGTGKMTNMKVLTPPGTTFKELINNKDDIRTVSTYSEDGGRTFLGIEEPTIVNSKRIGVRYAEQGGTAKDGVIELRRGVDDISLGKARYAQVRIAVDGTHYLKGMAMYSDKLPDGVDMMFNTNKSDTGNKLDAMKKMKDDKDNPFGSVVRQKHYLGKDGKQLLSALNIVGTEDPDGRKTPGEEGAWYEWGKTLSSQFLSKQPPALAKEQLGITFNVKKAELDEINSLTNPAIKKKLLKSYSDGADASAVHLKAAGLPRTRNHVILPINSLKDTEIYAPQYKNGEKVVLIRHPHGGIFEIPELTVNNKNREAKSLLENAIDAVGITAKVAERLSGADFDGDTVLVIPNNNGRVKHAPALEGLKDFDSKTYKLPDGVEFHGNKQQLMGDVSNLITDMTVKGAPNEHIARAVRHSMVVIDAEKHNLDYKKSAVDNGIKALKLEYQGKTNGGASTLISRAGGKISVENRKARSAKEGGAIDPATGKLMWTPTGESYVRRTESPKTGKVTEKTIMKTFDSKKMAETDDAFTLSSGTNREAVYAEHANKLKALANEARKSMIETPSAKYNASANLAYKPEVESLNAKLNIAQKNAPMERSAQLFAETVVKAKMQANPSMEKDEVKKIRGQALNEARLRMGAKKEKIVLTNAEWNAIQAGAITNNKLNAILDHADLDQVKQLATPREKSAMVPAKVTQAKGMLSRGYTQAEVAEALGISTSTLNEAIK